jgi:ankyrin repeat protein
MEANTDTNPSYSKVVEPLLLAHDGDASALIAAYPNFDPKAIANDFAYAFSYMHMACHQHHFHAVRGLVQCGVSLLRRETFAGMTPLHLACWSLRDEHMNIIAWLLSHKEARATVNWEDTVGSTPLHEAADNESVGVIWLLLKHGADLTFKNEEGHTPVAFARSEGNWKAVEILEAAERAQVVLHLGEWRPHKQACFPRGYRAAMRALVVLAKARKPNTAIGPDCERYPRACLDLLPEELLQYLFAYITTPHVPDTWTKREKK